VGRKETAEKNSEDGVYVDDPVVDEALEWFLRLRDAKPDKATLATFHAWIQQDPRHALEFKNLEAIWGSEAFGRAVAGLPANAFTRTVKASQARLKISNRSRRLALAASLAALAIGIWQFPSVLLRWQADYMTSAGMQSRVTLPDGSSMILNTASAVTIDFENGRREVQILKGEVYFDVLRDAERTFRVVGRFGDVEVKGTAFSVRSRDAEDQVVLERGRVDVRSIPRQSERLSLMPGQMGRARALSLTVEQVDPATVLAWREGRIVFDNQPFARVLQELSRYYSGSVILLADRVSDLPVTGNYRVDNAEAAIQILADAAGVTMNRVPGGIILLR